MKPITTFNKIADMYDYCEFAKYPQLIRFRWIFLRLQRCYNKCSNDGNEVK